MEGLPQAAMICRVAHPCEWRLPRPGRGKGGVFLLSLSNFYFLLGRWLGGADRGGGSLPEARARRPLVPTRPRAPQWKLGEVSQKWAAKWRNFGCTGADRIPIRSTSDENLSPLS
jgi:hypothetical protein